MSKPMVAIVGRPNVGKSTFFNYIVGKRISIVEDTPGVTRDRVYGEANWRGRSFTLIDTGGIEFDDSNDISIQMKEQADIAIAMADVIIFLTDAKQGFSSGVCVLGLGGWVVGFRNPLWRRCGNCRRQADH